MGNGKNGQRVPKFTEKVGKIMKKFQKARLTLSPSRKPPQTGAETESANVDESQLKTPSVDEIRPGKRAVLKDRCFRNDMKQLSRALLAERSTGNNKSIFETDHPPNLTSAAAKRKWAIEEAKGIWNVSEDDGVLASSAMAPNSFHEDFWLLPTKAKGRTSGKKDVLEPNHTVITEFVTEPLPFSALMPDDLTNQPPSNKIRPRAGRSIKRRRRDLKAAAAARRVDSSSSPLSLGTSSLRKFVIPDVPYDISEALSADVIDAAYDFIHNG